MDLWVDRSHTITLRPALSGQLALDDFQKTHTHKGEQVQMKGNFQY